MVHSSSGLGKKYLRYDSFLGVKKYTSFLGDKVQAWISSKEWGKMACCQKGFLLMSN